MTIITLTTDFGTEDAYVAQMKGVLCSAVSSAVRLVDLSHALPPQDVAAAARFLATAVPCFPKGTVHLAVIDPGVGSVRKALAIDYKGQWLVVPDNGIATAAIQDGGRAHVLDTKKVNPGVVSSTFHGRDIFAPAAAALAMGTPITSLGQPLEAPTLLHAPEPHWEGNTLVGQVLHVDHFGNLISNINWREHKRDQGIPEVACGDTNVGGLHNHYAEVSDGQRLALLDSHGHLEIAVRNGSAQRELEAAKGTLVRVTWRQP